MRARWMRRSYSGLRMTRHIPLEWVYLPFNAFMGVERWLVPDSVRDGNLIYPLTFGLLWRVLAAAVEMVWLSLVLVFLLVHLSLDWMSRMVSGISSTVRGV